MGLLSVSVPYSPSTHATTSLGTLTHPKTLPTPWLSCPPHGCPHFPGQEGRRAGVLFSWMPEGPHRDSPHPWPSGSG